MAEATTPPAAQSPSLQPPAVPGIPAPQPNDSQLPSDSATQLQSPEPAPVPPVNPNPNPSSALPTLVSPSPQLINPYANPQPPIGSSGAPLPLPAAPSFRPAGAPVYLQTTPQYTPIPGNPNLQSYQPHSHHGFPPPGVSSAPPGTVASSLPPPMVPAGMYQVPIGQQPNPLMRPPYAAIPNPYHIPQGAVPPPGVPRYTYPPIVRPAFGPRPPGPIAMVPSLQRPPILGMHPPGMPMVRPPIVPVPAPAEKPQTTVYVGKIAPTVENNFMLSLLELCGPVKSWKRSECPSSGGPRGFGFCEFESAEGVLRAMRLLSKLNVDGQELVLNVNQATKDYLESYVQKKKENVKKPEETEGEEEAKKDGGNETGVRKSDCDEMSGAPKPSTEEPKKDDESQSKEKDTANFGLVTDEDRKAEREALERLRNIIDERLKNKPLPPPPKVDGTTNSNSEVAAKSGDMDSDLDTARKDEKNDDETASEAKTTSRAGTVSPDRGRRHSGRGRERDRERDMKRDKERELVRLESERERDRARRERERDLEIQKAERLYKERVKEWEVREKDKEYQRKHEKEKEKERERERRHLIAAQEDDNDEDSRKRRRRSEIEEKRKKRRREKDEDLADRFKEEEEIAEAKKKAEEQRQQEKDTMLQHASAPVANGIEEIPPPEIALDDIECKVAERTYETDSGHINHIGDGGVENGSTDESALALSSGSDLKPNINAPAKKLGFGLSGSGKRTAVLSVFNEEEDDDAQKEKKMRPLVPIDYSTEELQAVQHTGAGGTPSNLAAATEFARRLSGGNSKEEKIDAERESRRRTHDRSSHRDRDRNDDFVGRSRDENRERSLDRERDREHGADKVKNSDGYKILDAKQLIDMIPKTRDELFSYDINWTVYDKHDLHERMRPWISKKITEFLGEEETTLVDYIVSSTQQHVKASKMLELLQSILDEEAEMFVLKMWRMLIFEIKRVETGLAVKARS